jgi:hypothetical protein
VAISRVATSGTTPGAGTAVATITATTPTGATTGDLLIVAATNSSGTLRTWSAGSYTGWTIAEDMTETNQICRVIYRILDGTGADAPPAMATSSTGQMVAVAGAYRGVDPVTPFIAESGQIEPATATSHSAPALTNTDVNAWGVLVGSSSRNVTPMTWTPGAGLTELQDLDSGLAGTTNATMTWCDTNGVVGSTGAITYSATTSGAAVGQAEMWAAFLTPAAAGGTTTKQTNQAVQNRARFRASFW